MGEKAELLKHTVLLFVLFCVSEVFSMEIKITPCKGFVDTGVNITDVVVLNNFIEEQLTLKFQLNTNKYLKNPELHFHASAGGATLPCDPKTEFGSCTYSLCGGKKYQMEKKLCPAWNCACPIRPGSYFNRAGATFALPPFSSLIGDIVTHDDSEIILEIGEGKKIHFCGGMSMPS